MPLQRYSYSKPRNRGLLTLLPLLALGLPLPAAAQADQEEGKAKSSTASKTASVKDKDEDEEKDKVGASDAAAGPAAAASPTTPSLLSSEAAAKLKAAMQEEVEPAPDLDVPLTDVPTYGDDVGTATSANLEAAGDFARDAGAATLLRSRAAIHLQEAAEKHLENEVNYVKAYYAKRRAWKKAHRQARENRVTASEAEKIAATRSPDRLGEDVFNPQSGQILWPPVLDSEPLQSHREAIGRQFKRRSSPGYDWNRQNVEWVQANVEAMQKALETVKADLSLQPYIALSRFLEQVAWEAEFDRQGNRVQIAS
jgi:hypothetical protein